MKNSKWALWTGIILGAVYLLIIFSGEGLFDLFPLMFFIAGGCLIYYGLKGKPQNAHKSELPALSKKREQSYVNAGMSDSEIDMFRQTMNQTKKQIIHLQATMNQSGKLRAVDLRHDTIKAAKALFKEIVASPKRMPEANHFLYTHLPNLVDLTDKFVEINEHEIKNRDTYEKIEESIQIIDQMAALIAIDYQKFVADDLDDLDVEISIAKQSLKQNGNY
ncbi:5-bromo-4-chloroindolyl phosphate hydrolysis family protein [Tetragenococcus solitarius]|uniref:5-bromo-4-chloroindolyl phosphate hydrolysis family protein n=1 Tax=Tetragenococcus solitarius TaxID=71453 RepID=A0ABN3XZW1_9ENTE|nr:5-bromo-4-chloroindolyl phosphate hydrolysis family protein [Tetragenococcus solitarius]